MPRRFSSILWILLVLLEPTAVVVAADAPPNVTTITIFGPRASASIRVERLAASQPLMADGKLSLGEVHSCGVTAEGGVKCWGYNASGELGDGTTTDRLIPVRVKGLGNGVSAVTAGGSHTCALTSAGGVKCWGSNYHGQLGDGTYVTRLKPVDVIGLTTGVAAISAGKDHTCALTKAGGVKCWGWNGHGQLGDGTTSTRTNPVDVSGFAGGAMAIAAGGVHTCALTKAGGAMCWGWNYWGQLGEGTTTERHTPVFVHRLRSRVVVISAGLYHTCALTDAGHAKCWGNNDFGQLGDGTKRQRHIPIRVRGVPDGIAIAAAVSLTCALPSAARPRCWGGNAHGELGNGTWIDSAIPVHTKVNAISIAVGWEHACAVTEHGHVRCWGAGFDGQLGNGGQTKVNVPTRVLHFAP